MFAKLSLLTVLVGHAFHTLLGLWVADRSGLLAVSTAFGWAGAGIGLYITGTPDASTIRGVQALDAGGVCKAVGGWIGTYFRAACIATVRAKTAFR